MRHRHWPLAHGANVNRCGLAWRPHQKRHRACANGRVEPTKRLRARRGPARLAREFPTLARKRGWLVSKPANVGFKRIANATRYSVRGLRAAWRHEAAFRQECVAALLLTPCAFLLAATLTQAALLLATLALVLVVELLNSALEAAVDRIGQERHELAARAKDMGSAAVFVSLAIVAFTWGLAALDRFLSH